MLEWNQGATNVWVTLLGDPVDSLLLTHTEGTLTMGQAYKFRLTAENAHGWGAVSAETTIIASELPAIMPTVTTSNDGTNVKIVWD